MVDFRIPIHHAGENVVVWSLPTSVLKCSCHKVVTKFILSQGCHKIFPADSHRLKQVWYHMMLAFRGLNALCVYQEISGNILLQHLNVVLVHLFSAQR